MRRSVSLFLILVLLFASLPTFSAGSSPALAESDGVWHLESYDMLDPIPGENKTTTISDGNSSMKVVSPESGDVFESSATWTSPGNSYRAGDTITINISVKIDNYVWNGENDGYIHMGLNYMSNTIYARLDDADIGYGGVTGGSIDLLDADGNYKCQVSTDNGKIVIGNESREISAQFPSGYEDGERISLHVSNKGGLARYNYVWQADPVEETTIPPEITASEEPTPTPAPNAKTIALRGKVLGVDGRPMRRMKLDVSAWFDAEAGMLESSPDWTLESTTDARGLFKAEISVPEEQENDVQIMMRGELRCILPDDSETYYIVDLKEEQAHEQVMVSSWFSVDVNDPFYEDADIIPVYRLAAFFLIPDGAWTIDDREFLPDAFTSNVADNTSLAAHSYTYNMLWDAQFVGGHVFNEIDKLSEKTLRVETNWEQTDSNDQLTISHFEPNDNIIRLQIEDSKYNDLSRFTTLHEYGHYFDQTSSDDTYYRTYVANYNKGGRNEPHGGYMNSSTSDSFIEGFASAYAGLVQLIAGMDNPHQAGFIDLSNAGYYTAWGVNGSEEELAIALLLYQMLFSYDTPEEYWSILEPVRDDFQAYYQAFADSLGESDQEKLRSLTLAGGLYKMPFGNDKYDYGEPFIDLPVNSDSQNKTGNKVYDSNESYADLMYEIYENGYVDTSRPLKKFNEDELILGQVADASRPERSTTLLHPNNYIYLNSADGSLPDNIMLTFNYKDGQTTKMLFPVEEDQGIARVYIGLSSQPVEGELEISIPGGNTIYEGKLDNLHEQFVSTIGQDIPLAKAEIKAADLAPDGTMAAPTEGNPDAAGILYIPNAEEMAAANQQAGEEAANFDIAAGLEVYAVELENSSIWGSSSSESMVSGVSGPENVNSSSKLLKTILIVLSILLLLATAALVIVLLISRSRKLQAANQNHYVAPTAVPHQFVAPTASPTAVPPIQTQQPSSTLFCQHCGSKLESGTIFCSNCGQRID